MENDELKEIAAQLRHPSGEKGTAMAHMMNETNIGMTKNAVKNLELAAGDTVLELGHGNCGHLNHVFEQAPDLHYHGLELSALMNQEARDAHRELIAQGKAQFGLYDGLHIPFPENHFDKLFTVNTIYFWSQPETLLASIYGVLKPGGKCCLTFADGEFMQSLPFAQFGFELYSIPKVEALIATTPFQIVCTDAQTEQVKTKAGDWVERQFYTVVLTK